MSHAVRATPTGPRRLVSLGRTRLSSHKGVACQRPTYGDFFGGPVCVWFLSPFPQPGRVGSSVTVGGGVGVGVGVAGVVTARVVGAVVGAAAGGTGGAGVVEVPVGGGAAGPGFGVEPRPPRAARVLASATEGPPAAARAEPAETTCGA